MLRRVVFLPALRYVDDFFSADEGDGVGDAAAAAAELIRVLLGDDAIQARKLEWGSPLVVLGVEVQAASAASPPARGAHDAPRAGHEAGILGGAGAAEGRAVVELDSRLSDRG